MTETGIKGTATAHFVLFAVRCGVMERSATCLGLFVFMFLSSISDDEYYSDDADGEDDDQYYSGEDADLAAAEHGDDAEDENSDEDDEEADATQLEQCTIEMGASETSKGQKCVVLRGHIYIQSCKSKTDNTYWKCQENNCGGRLNLSKHGKITKMRPHQHPPVPEKPLVSDFKMMLKQMAREEATPIKQLYEDLKQSFEAARGVNVLLPAYKSVKTAAYRARNLAKEGTPVQLGISEMMTEIGERWLLADKELKIKGEKKRLVVFCDNFLLNILAHSLVWMMDGTFSSAPEGFKQLYTIHCEYNGELFPVVYALLQGKSKIIYAALFRILKRKIQAIGCPTRGPNAIHSDFELAAINAARDAFPATKVVGCYFHFTQANYKHVKTTIGEKDNLNNEDLRLTIREFWALPFLPLDEVEDGFNELLSKIPRMNAKLRKYIEYFQTTWIDAKIDPQLWNVHEERNRTNNKVEAWHRRLNSRIQTKAPRIHCLLSVLKTEQNLARIRVIELQSGVPTIRDVSKADEERESLLKEAQMSFREDGMTRTAYLRRCAYIYLKTSREENI